MGGEKRAPRRPLIPLRPGLDAVFPQNIGDGTPGYGMAQIREGTANTCIPPLRFRLRHPHNKVANLGHDPGPSDLFSPLAVVPLPHNEPSVPSQQGFRCDDSGDFCQEFPAKRLTLHYGRPCRLRWSPSRNTTRSYGNLDPSGRVDSLKEQTSCEQQRPPEGGQRPCSPRRLTLPALHPAARLDKSGSVIAFCRGDS